MEPTVRLRMELPASREPSSGRMRVSGGVDPYNASGFRGSRSLQLRYMGGGGCQNHDFLLCYPVNLMGRIIMDPDPKP